MCFISGLLLAILLDYYIIMLSIMGDVMGGGSPLVRSGKIRWTPRSFFFGRCFYFV